MQGYPGSTDLASEGPGMTDSAYQKTGMDGHLWPQSVDFFIAFVRKCRDVIGGGREIKSFRLSIIVLLLKHYARYEGNKKTI